MLGFSAILGGIYLIGLTASFLKVNRWLTIKTADGAPEGLDALTALGAAVFWPVWILPYSMYRLIKL
jgi:hypothetical protein